MRAVLFLLINLKCVLSYWDLGTTTESTIYVDQVPRQSFFRWQRTEFDYLQFWFPYFDWDELWYRRSMNCMAGISIDFLPLSTAVLLNRRVLITAANFLEPYLNRQRDLRIWALGRAGHENTPYRYRVWRVQRLFPRSINPEHMHGPRGTHVPRHDVSIIHSLDQMYLFYSYPTRFHFAYKSILTGKHDPLENVVWFSGSGFETLEHIYQNYKIFYQRAYKTNIVDCSKYLPKWWGKFICIWQPAVTGVQNGGGLFSKRILVGIGCFSIRYNQDRILVFTDLRYYVDFIFATAHIYIGEYYEYAYPQWGVYMGNFYDSYYNYPIIPHFQKMYDFYPLGKK